ncbi:MAG TPA: hypothetical protein VG164_12140, partial [Trebonia sp.]|nr:hypothetical protein [Trebonia sp.]
EDAAHEPLELDDGAAVVALGPFATVTIAVQVAARKAAAGGGPATAGPTAAEPRAAEPAEPAQPVYSRYWLHGKGAAPAGNIPVTAHFTPSRVTLGAGAAGRLRLTVAGGPEPASGEATLALPDTVSAEIDGAPADAVTTLRYDLPPGGFTSWDVTVTAKPGAPDGRYFAAGSIVDRAGNTIEDAALLTIGEAGEVTRDLPPEELFFRLQADSQALTAEADVAILDSEIRLPPGGRGRLRVQVTSSLASRLRGELQLISPLGTWESTGPWTRAVTVAPGGEAACDFAVAVPPTAAPGWESWLLVKLMYFGRVRYSQPVRITADQPG